MLKAAHRFVQCDIQLPIGTDATFFIVLLSQKKKKKKDLDEQNIFKKFINT